MVIKKGAELQEKKLLDLYEFDSEINLDKKVKKNKEKQ